MRFPIHRDLIYHVTLNHIERTIQNNQKFSDSRDARISILAMQINTSQIRMPSRRPMQTTISQFVNMKQTTKILFNLFVITLGILLLFDSFALAEKGRDIIIYNGKVILKGGKKKGNIIVSSGGETSHYGGQGKYKYKKKYMDYGGFWRK